MSSLSTGRQIKKIVITVSYSLGVRFRSVGPKAPVTAQCVRWYLAYSLSLRNLEELMVERVLAVDYATLHW